MDIDPQAVEVTKLSLLLKVLENESADTLESQLKLFAERALPDLGNNIKCGNSLIGPDFYEQQQMTLLDDEEIYRINAFDWNEAFPEVFGGPCKRLWLVTFVTHNTRISERMKEYGISAGDAVTLPPVVSKGLNEEQSTNKGLKPLVDLVGPESQPLVVVGQSIADAIRRLSLIHI